MLLVCDERAAKLGYANVRLKAGFFFEEGVILGGNRGLCSYGVSPVQAGWGDHVNGIMRQDDRTCYK